MISFKICQSCEHCMGGNKADIDSEGDIVRIPDVYCSLSSMFILNIDDDPPDECPNKVSHMAQMEYVPEDFLCRLSGKSRCEV